MENFGNRPVVTTLGISPSCEKSVPNLAETYQKDLRFTILVWALHSFHIQFTD